MDRASVVLIFNYLKGMPTVSQEVKDLIDRVESGFEITLDELQIAAKAQLAVNDEKQNSD